MATKLRRLRLNRCDLVDRPANPHAQVVIFKRAPNFLEWDLAFFAKKAAEEAKPSEDGGLVAALNATIASSYRLYIVAHSAHWNVEGAMFPAWHDFFATLYEDVFGAIDSFAESIRQHGAYAPTSFGEILGNDVGSKVGASVPALISLNAAHMSILTALRGAADAAPDEGLANFCQERMAKHLKYDWQLRAMEK